MSSQGAPHSRDLYLLLSVVCLAASFMRCDSHAFQHPLLLSRHRRSLIFTEDSYVELYVSLAWPVPLENENVVASVGFTSDYDVPTNASQLYEPYTVARVSRAAPAGGRGFGRLAVYSAIEKYLTRYGFEGRDCLQRSICEMATTSVRHNGLVGDLLHIIFTPSTSVDTELPAAYLEAEEAGRRLAGGGGGGGSGGGRGGCGTRFPRCPHSPLDLVAVDLDAL